MRPAVDQTEPVTAKPAAQPPAPPTRAAIRTYCSFEKPIAELESKVSELKTMAKSGGAVSIADEIKKLEQKAKSP
jgi:acetyl-CoA carboxylase carboxyl transferase subunit alpha